MPRLGYLKQGDSTRQLAGRPRVCEGDRAAFVLVVRGRTRPVSADSIGVCDGRAQAHGSRGLLTDAVDADQGGFQAGLIRRPRGMFSYGGTHHHALTPGVVAFDRGQLFILGAEGLIANR